MSSMKQAGSGTTQVSTSRLGLCEEILPGSAGAQVERTFHRSANHDDCHYSGKDRRLGALHTCQTS